jgi:hypothetical protein
VPVTADDVRAAGAWSKSVLGPLSSRDWTVATIDCDRTCRQTLDHLVDCMLFYAAALAQRAYGYVGHVRRGSPDASTIPELLTACDNAISIFGAVLDAAPADARAFHPAGIADTEGWAAMGCDEILVHTYELAASVGSVREAVPDALAARVVRRLFPWAPDEFDGFATLLWCNGRIALGPHERVAPNWAWHCAPLSEWNGNVCFWA